MTKTKISHIEFFDDIRKFLEINLGQYQKYVRISGNRIAAHVAAEITLGLGDSVKLWVEADFLEDPDNAKVKVTIAISGSQLDVDSAFFMASTIEKVAQLGILIEEGYRDTTVFLDMDSY